MSGEASLGRRLLTAAAIFIAAALIAATVLIGFVLHRFVQRQIDERLDTQIVFLASMLRVTADGKLSLAGNADGPPFERPRHGWYWQVTGPKTTLRSVSLEDETLDSPAIAERLPPRGGPKERQPDKAFPADGEGPDGEQLHFRIRQLRVDGQLVAIVASAPREAVLRPLGEALTTLGLSLAALGLALLIATLLQVRLGLRPLARLRQSIADVRAGRVARVPTAQPREVAPLVQELNGLLDENEANLKRARRHVANLAHGLKTPLATLSLALADGRQDDSALPSLVQVMDRRIRHHLGRARAAALGGPARLRTPVASRIQDLGDAIAKIHAARGLSWTIHAPGDLAVACEAQDFDEMAGNLMDNGFKWARTKVRIAAAPLAGGRLSISIEDDGAGLSESDIARVTLPGERLDESTPGFGFGLSIVRELAELYGGRLDLDRSPLGGLRARLILPMAAP